MVSVNRPWPLNDPTATSRLQWGRRGQGEAKGKGQGKRQDGSMSKIMHISSALIRPEQGGTMYLWAGGSCGLMLWADEREPKAAQDQAKIVP